ncbi:uncharacterized protein VTP21DRAFT_638 [Calcarisporiella thermophila]|uniref:uncharacterized protein n=1 Tax=Calcarisporiella thermophila TaxID=911321 RepID=UPI0037435B5F
MPEPIFEPIQVNLSRPISKLYTKSQNGSNTHSSSSSAPNHSSLSSDNSAFGPPCPLPITPSVPSSRKSRQPQPPLRPPTLTRFRPALRTSFLLEYSIHSCPRRLVSEIKYVFPNIELEQLLIVPTFQRTRYDLVEWGEPVAKEKDEKLENFVAWGSAVVEYMRAQGFWADITDPCSGFPMFTEHGPSPYPDVSGIEQLLRYDTLNTGCCKVVLHPRWGSRMYPATLFTTAPLEALTEAIDAVGCTRGLGGGEDEEETDEHEGEEK